MKGRRTAMSINRVAELVNKDNRLLVLLTGMLLDILILIGLMVYMSLKLVS